jgi:hypothetical protein
MALVKCQPYFRAGDFLDSPACRARMVMGTSTIPEPGRRLGLDGEPAVAHGEGHGLQPGVHLQVIRGVPDADYAPCVDKEQGQVAEFGYRTSKETTFRRYVVKRIAIAPGEQATLETAGYRYWVSVTNDHTTDAPALESEHRHKALVEGGMRELKENFGLRVLRKHGFMANWAWLLVVATGLNLARVAALAAENEILITTDAAGALGGSSFNLSEARTVSVKGIAKPVEVIVVEWRSGGPPPSRSP